MKVICLIQHYLTHPLITMLSVITLPMRRQGEPKCAGIPCRFFLNNKMHDNYGTQSEKTGYFLVLLMPTLAGMGSMISWWTKSTELPTVGNQRYFLMPLISNSQFVLWFVLFKSGLLYEQFYTLIAFFMCLGWLFNLVGAFLPPNAKFLQRPPMADQCRFG